MTEKQAQENAGIPGWLNAVMTFILRTPLLNRLVSGKIMLITFTGRKSGKTYTTPVSYLKETDTVTLFTHSPWWKNLAEGAPVVVRIKGKNLTGTATAVPDDKEATAAVLDRHLRNNRMDAKYYSVTYDESGNPNPDQVRAAAENAVMVRVKLN